MQPSGGRPSCAHPEYAHQTVLLWRVLELHEPVTTPTTADSAAISEASFVNTVQPYYAPSMSLWRAVLLFSAAATVSTTAASTDQEAV